MDRGNLDVRFDSDDPGCVPLMRSVGTGPMFRRGDGPRAVSVAVNEVEASARAVRRPLSDTVPLSVALPVSSSVRQRFLSTRGRRRGHRVTLELRGLAISGVTAVGYDVYVNVPDGVSPTRDLPNYVGTIPLFGLNHSPPGHGEHEQSDTGVSHRIDITSALEPDALEVEVQIVPFDLLRPVTNLPRLRRPGNLSIGHIAVVIEERTER